MLKVVYFVPLFFHIKANRLIHINIKTVFLNGELGEKIYMDQPIGLEVKEQGCKVCYLKRSIYGLN